ncbi:MAG: RNA polymerase sigma factor, partial [Planctomycetes bacterium]|nr:RNA polymerase sigma factor [Planctomycetota bacterium]
AEEATQETFVRALRALPGLRSPERFRSWLLTIAANTSKELARKRPRTTGLDLDALPFEPADDRGVERRRIAVEAAIGRLGEDERDLFLLHTLEGVPLEDLARDRQVSTGAMKSRVHRIREKVREMAQDHLESQGEIP